MFFRDPSAREDQDGDEAIKKYCRYTHEELIAAYKNDI